MTELYRVRRALLSVSDKTGIVEFARELVRMGVEIVSTGGTAALLARESIPVVQVESLTGFPEMMDGRLKTLHPLVHGGILAVRDDEGHARSMREHDIQAIDLVCVNLYPFEQAASRTGVSEGELIENIDIGGPTMIRSAAKNFRFVAVVCDPAQYEGVLAELREHVGQVTLGARRRLSAEAFARTAAYDAAIAGNMRDRGVLEPLAEHLTVGGRRVLSLRYGENPHQSAGAYVTAGAGTGGILGAEVLHGKELSYNNVNDADAVLRLVKAMALASGRGVAAAVVKHTNPCGAVWVSSDETTERRSDGGGTRSPTVMEGSGARDEETERRRDEVGGGLSSLCRDAVEAALAGDPLAAYGGVMAISSVIDEPAAELLCAREVFLEVLCAPGYTPAALEMLRSRSKNMRILRLADNEFSQGAKDTLEFRSILGGLLAQTGDTRVPTPTEWVHAAGPRLEPGLVRQLGILECIARALTSNAVCIGLVDERTVQLIGAGAGQMDRVAACKIAVEKAGGRLHAGMGGSVPVAFSDAFFPFDDGPKVLIDAGVEVIIHPGGSRRDPDTFALCNARGVTCLTTGVRHFRH